MTSNEAKHLTHYLHENDPRCQQCGGALLRGVNSDFCSQACEDIYYQNHPEPGDRCTILCSLEDGHEGRCMTEEEAKAAMVAEREPATDAEYEALRREQEG